jgi:hypothetical protein
MLALTMVATVICAEPAASTKPAEAANPETNQLAVSRFTWPTTLNEGRDPFHPSSTWVVAVNRPKEPENPDSGPATLELKGISGPPERRLAIINNRTLAVGEKQQVNTPQGRVLVTCLAIEGTTVRIEAQGQTRELMLRKGI